MRVLVTNYKKGIFNKPLLELYPKERFELNKNELSINDCLFCHVFDVLPKMRNLEVNKSWFNTNLYHFKPV